MKRLWLLQKQSDGGFIDWGRHASVNGVRGEGGARRYTGEAASVLNLLLKYSAKKGKQSE